MPLDFITQLEDKVDVLVTTLLTTKNEVKDKEVKISLLEEENQNLKSHLESMREQVNQNQNQMEFASEKIKALLTKLETVA